MLVQVLCRKKRWYDSLERTHHEDSDIGKSDNTTERDKEEAVSEMRRLFLSSYLAVRGLVFRKYNSAKHLLSGLQPVFYPVNPVNHVLKKEIGCLILVRNSKSFSIYRIRFICNNAQPHAWDFVVNKRDNGGGAVETRQCLVSTKLTPGQLRFQNQGKNTISSIIGSYKSINPDFEWQSRFYDHIIRDSNSFERIQNYIMNNPANWKEDKFYS